MGFYHALSGLNAASQSLDVIGHNIANSSTTGFKSSRTEFAEAVASAVGSSSGSSSGIGVTTANVTQKFTQGTVSPTGRNLDVAINGSGFFVVKQSDGSSAYTRSGNFQVDKSGNLLSATGDQIMGYTLNPETGTKTNTTLVGMQFPTGRPIPAKETGNVSLSLNLDARAPNAVGDMTATPPVTATPRPTYGTSLKVFDSQGVAIPLNFYFEKSGANTWNVFNGLDNPSATPRVVSPATGQIVADSTGNTQGLIEPIQYPTIPATDTPFTKEAHYPSELKYTFYGPDSATPPEYALRTVTITGASPADIWDFSYDATDPTIVTSASLKNNLTTATGLTTTPALTAAPKAEPQSYNLSLTVNPSLNNPNSSTTAGGSPGPGVFTVVANLDQISQFGTQFAVSDLKQDGYTSGVMNDISISKDGSIVAIYSNGVSRAEAQLGLADFRNPQGLQAIGENKWVWTPDAGEIIPGTAGTGTFGSLQAGALEESNVDLTAELVNMMTAQRAYQANAQAIKTQDQVFSTLVNLR